MSMMPDMIIKLTLCMLVIVKFVRKKSCWNSVSFIRQFPGLRLSHLKMKLVVGNTFLLGNEMRKYIITCLVRASTFSMV